MHVRKIRALVDRFPVRPSEPMLAAVLVSSRGYETAPAEPTHLLPWADPYIASLHRQLERDASHGRRNNRGPSRHPGKHIASARAHG